MNKNRNQKLILSQKKKARKYESKIKIGSRPKRESKEYV